jgi:hypothetical protein
LRGLDHPKPVAIDRLDNEALGVNPLERIGDRSGTSRGAIVACTLEATLDHGASDQRTGRIVHRNDGRIFRHTLKTFGHGQMAVCSTFDHSFQLARGGGPGNLLELGPRAGRTNQNNRVNEL